jgi:hypothetical protein
MLLTVVADYGTGDLAFAEVCRRFALLLPDADVAGRDVFRPRSPVWSVATTACSARR